MEINKAVFGTFPVLETRRILLREIRPADASAIRAMRASGRVNQFIAREAMATQEQAEVLVVRTIAAFEQQQGIGWAGELKDHGAMIGTCGFNSIDYPNLRAEIGGELAVAQWGRQIALEAVSAIIQFGMETMRLHSIEAKVSPANRGAIALLSHLGFRKEAHFRERIWFNGSFSDMAVYTLIGSA
ncbi:GNAT family N-acetyltransferase [Taibaiella koreensis]|uniref:GNAT family N-acetyltransferase n=1 Tax=Taibaiella koreensis TaxID=1268548 RepID=UPI000E59C48F|nr:GNAT family protein [Taibaiella koreensis]